MGKITFIDGDPSKNILGTIVSSAFLNAINNHRHQGRDVDGDGVLDYAISTGAANAYQLALYPALTAHIPGMPIWFCANFTNTLASTININGLGAVSLKKGVTTALAAGDIQAGQMYLIMYDGINYQVLNAALAGLGAANSGLFMDANGISPIWGSTCNVCTATRDLASASGSVSYTGVGFKPRAVIILGQSAITSPAGGNLSIGSGSNALYIQSVTSGYCNYGYAAGIVIGGIWNSNFQLGVVASLDADGMTLMWTKTGTPSGTMYLTILYIR